MCLIMKYDLLSYYVICIIQIVIGHTEAIIVKNTKLFLIQIDVLVLLNFRM